MKWLCKIFGHLDGHYLLLARNRRFKECKICHRREYMGPIINTPKLPPFMIRSDDFEKMLEIRAEKDKAYSRVIREEYPNTGLCKVCLRVGYINNNFICSICAYQLKENEKRNDN